MIVEIRTSQFLADTSGSGRKRELRSAAHIVTKCVWADHPPWPTPISTELNLDGCIRSIPKTMSGSFYMLEDDQ